MFRTAKEQMKPNQDLERQRRQGDDPHGADENGLLLSCDWEVLADGRPITIYSTPVTRGGPHSFGRVAFNGNEKTVMLRSANRSIEDITVAPQSAGAKISREGEWIILSIQKECHVTITVNGGIDRPLTLSFLRDIPKPKENCRIIKAGLYDFDFYDFSDNEILYLEDGAVLRALPHDPIEKPVREKDWAGKNNYRVCLSGEKKRRISILGYGIVDFSRLDWHERDAVKFTECSEILIDGITLVNACAWTLTLFRCRDIAIRRIRIFGYRENSDGVDIVSSENVQVCDCFFRTGDDAIAVKAMCPPPVCGGKHIRCTRNVAWNDKVRCFGVVAESLNDISDVQFTDSDVIRSYADWTYELGSLVVYICDNAFVSDILFENIRIEHECKFAVNVLIRKDFWSKSPDAGVIDGVTFRDIFLSHPVPSVIKGFDNEHRCRNVVFQRFSVAGRVCRSLSEADIRVAEFADHITIEP